MLVVTMTGTAEMIAEDIQHAHPGHELQLILAEKADSSVFRTHNLMVISSTYGLGEIPEPGKPLFESVSNLRPDLSGLRYGVIALGDSNYTDTFANGGRLWDDLLQKLGASRLAETLVLDASGAASMSELALAWANHWLGIASTNGEARQDIPA